MVKRHIRNEIRFDNTTRALPALQLGETVLIQNQTSPKPNRWSKTGRVVEDLGHRQFHIKIDGSNRITLRKRKFLKRILPVASAGNNGRSTVTDRRYTSLTGKNVFQMIIVTARSLQTHNKHLSFIDDFGGIDGRGEFNQLNLFQPMFFCRGPQVDVIAGW